MSPITYRNDSAPFRFVWFLALPASIGEGGAPGFQNHKAYVSRHHNDLPTANPTLPRLCLLPFAKVTMTISAPNER